VAVDDAHVLELLVNQVSAHAAGAPVAQLVQREAWAQAHLMKEKTAYAQGEGRGSQVAT